MKTITKNRKVRYNQPHPIDLQGLKKPLMVIGAKEDRSIPYLVRKAVKDWIERNYPELKSPA